MDKVLEQCLMSMIQAKRIITHSKDLHPRISKLKKTLMNTLKKNMPTKIIKNDMNRLAVEFSTQINIKLDFFTKIKIISVGRKRVKSHINFNKENSSRLQIMRLKRTIVIKKVNLIMKLRYYLDRLLGHYNKL